MRKFSTLKFNIKTFNPENYNLNESTSSLSFNDEYKAPEHCMNNIMSFARAYKVKESSQTGKIELILN